MGFDISMVNADQAESDGIDSEFCESSITVNGMSRLRAAMPPDSRGKFVFNDGQYVMPDECRVISRHVAELVVAKSSLIRVRTAFFIEWSYFCDVAADYGGLEVR